jgi:hypothetical protein
VIDQNKLRRDKMTARQIVRRLEKVEEIIEKDERDNFHTYKYMEKIIKEAEKLRKALYFECA